MLTLDYFVINIRLQGPKRACYKHGVAKWHGVYITNITDDEEENFSLAFLEEVLAKLKTEEGKKISRLGLAFCPLGEKGIKLLIKNLPDLPHLKGIELHQCEIGTEGAIELAKFLRTNSTLLEVRLKGNHIGNGAFETLKSAFKKNETLRKVTLSGNNINLEHINTLKSLIKLNETHEGSKDYFEKIKAEHFY